MAVAIAFNAVLPRGTPAADAPAKPNILLIFIDDLGYGELGCQGQPEIPTPHIDSIARNGIRFTSGYVSGPVCSPSRAGLMTGRYQQRFGHEFNPGPPATPGTEVGLPLEEKTLADRLKAAGYATGVFGKWHLGDKLQFHPMKRGFDEFFGFAAAAGHPYLDPNGGSPILRGYDRVTEMEQTTDAFGHETVAFIEKHRATPWFAFLSFNAVHDPLETLPKYLDRFSAIENPRRRIFAGMLSAADDAVGAVLEKIREHQLEENTLIFFLSDNGGPTSQTTSRNTPLNGAKGMLLEGGIRVPFLAQWKGRIPAGQTDDRPVISLDILPTALAAAGVTAPADAKVEGVNLLPFLTGEKTEAPHKALFWRFGVQRAVRMGDWKLLDQGSGAKLHHLKNDISEKVDLSAIEPEKLKELEAAYREWNAANIEPKWWGGTAGAKAREARNAPAEPPDRNPSSRE
jgi:arylsulfatase A-like enzyme